MSFSFPRTGAVVVILSVALLAAQGALGQAAKLFPPDLGVEGQSLDTSVAFALIVTPSYSTPKPGVTVTMTNCKHGQRAPIRVLRRAGVHPGETLRIRPGKIVWDIKTLPGKPKKRKIRLWLAIPANASSTFCTTTTMYDKLTKNSATITTRVPL
jgi:hypothetical protein